MVLVKELIICVAFVTVAVKGFPRVHEEDAMDDDNGEGERKDADIDRTDGGHGGDHHRTHSYYHFLGPVIGHHEEVFWKDKHGHHHYDYKAHPKYKYSYGVDDHHSKGHHGHKEHRDGKHVEGEYHVHEPGGNVRSVKYHAGPDGGFYAEVHNYGGNDHSSSYGSHSH